MSTSRETKFKAGAGAVKRGASDVKRKIDCPQVSRVFIDKTSESELHLYQIADRGLRRKTPGKMCRLAARNPAALVGALERAG
jgi:hypothetical protein